MISLFTRSSAESFDTVGFTPFLPVTEFSSCILGTGLNKHRVLGMQ